MVSTKKKPVVKRSKRVTVQDVMIAYLTSGIGAVDKMVQDRKSLRSVVKKAADKAARTSANRALIDYAGGLTERRGIKPPEVGDRRPYVVQGRKSGAARIVIPVGTLGVTPMDVLDVSFEEGRIVVRREA